MWVVWLKSGIKITCKEAKSFGDDYVVIADITQIEGDSNNHFKTIFSDKNVKTFRISFRDIEVLGKGDSTTNTS